MVKLRIDFMDEPHFKLIIIILKVEIRYEKKRLLA